MSEKVYLAVDLGAESGRVIAGLFDGTHIRLEELHRFPNGPVTVAGTRRWDLIGLWKEIQDGLRNAANKFGKKIVSVGVDTWGVDYVLLSSKGEMLGQPYNYRDSRTDGMLEHACTRVSKKDIFAATGLQFMPINSLYQVLSMQLKDPELLAMADRFLMIPDFFHWLLCGSRVVEFTNATTTQFFDPRRRTWSLDLLRKLDIPTRMLPDVVPPGTNLGKLRADVSQITGLPRIDVVAPATHDTGAAVAAVPTDKTGTARWAYISSGTWSLIGVEVQQAILTDEALKQNVTNEGGIDGTYRLLKNVMGLWLVQGCRRSFERSGNDFDYTQLTHLATQAEPFRSLVHPNDPQFLNPDDMVVAMQDWCCKQKQPVPETEGQIIRCALESLALKYRDVLQGIEKLTGETIEVIHIVGGGCKNSLLNQFTADACGRPVIAGPTEATALGNVLIQARAAGQINSLAEIRKVVKASCEIETFEPRDTAEWNTAFKRYQALTASAI
ncbi:rhamnulokinase [Planctomicrobium piriforme]|uniref:Rhamnulokinase n=1 Tax=Planctomicrobium piriforme TaxID=1576369 RepID=A0A1I3DC84_9PLAN|nr:rhamnulokinase family protein [Planctomicrobium piriforme]SFH84380.1 rhamnulokinase [Planctomicrobium piriforme]